MPCAAPDHGNGFPDSIPLRSHSLQPQQLLRLLQDGSRQGLLSPSSTAVLSELAPEQQERRQEVIEGDNEEAVDKLVALLR